jgi:plastocyanin
VPDAFAATYTVENAQGSSTPGCDPYDCFIPSTLDIVVGDMVTFVNNDSAAHTSTSGNPGSGDAGSVWDSNLVMSGSSYTTAALDAGQYPYHCLVHPWMTGIVIVEEASPYGSAESFAPTFPNPIVISNPRLESMNPDVTVNENDLPLGGYIITADLHNDSDDDQSIAYWVQVTGPQSYEGWNYHNMSVGNTDNYGVNWIPEIAGDYTITINVVESMDDQPKKYLDVGVTFQVTISPDPYATESEPTLLPSSDPNTVLNDLGSSTPGCEPNCFIPATITIKAGESVTFSNTDTAAHTSTSVDVDGVSDGVWDSNLVMSGSAYTTPALDAGEYPYFCMVHPWMTGLVIVEEMVVEVTDTIPPQVLVPADIVIETGNQNGVSATFNPQAIDNVDEILSPTCNFSSGSIFPIGTTEVICTATDSSGNSNSNSFNVIVEFSGILIPEWIKNVAGFWHAGDINDQSFLEGIQYLIQNDILIVPETEVDSESSGTIPEWVKNTAGWWATGQIDDVTFVNGIQFLIQSGLIQVS